MTHVDEDRLVVLVPLLELFDALFEAGQQRNSTGVFLSQTLMVYPALVGVFGLHEEEEPAEEGPAASI